jgi:putative flavoprotein involved in K+ transport
MTMPRVETLVVGAGQAGLAISRCLTERGTDHVVVERGQVAERWRTARWDSLRLITPNWMSRLPA